MLLTGFAYEANSNGQTSQRFSASHTKRKILGTLFGKSKCGNPTAMFIITPHLGYRLCFQVRENLSKMIQSINNEFVKEYRFHNRFGSCSSRCSHSNPNLLAHSGALLIVPAWKSNAAPTPSKNAFGKCDVFAFIQYSCFGAPSPTQTSCAPELRIAFSWAVCSSSDSSRNGGDTAPTILLPG